MTVTPEWAAVIVGAIAAVASLLNIFMSNRINYKFEQLKVWTHSNFVAKSDLMNFLEMLKPGLFEDHK